MSAEDEIKWVELKIDLSSEQEEALQKCADARGLSLKCYCVHVLYEHLLRDASAVQKEEWLRDFPATLRRNGCQEALSV